MIAAWTSGLGVAHADAPPVVEPPVVEPAAVEPPAIEPLPTPVTPLPPADLPSPGTAADTTRGKVGYDEGLYVATADENFRLKLSGWVIGRWGLASVANDITQRFSVPGARLFLNGVVFATTSWTLSVELGTGAAVLRDAYVDRPLLGTTLRIGQFKRPLSRQFVTSRSKLQFSERAITTTWLGEDRDIGASLWRRPAPTAAGIEYTVAAFSGYGTALRSTCNDATPQTCSAPAESTADGRPTLVARFGWTSRMADTYDEGDYDGGPARFSIAGAYLVDLADGDTGAMTHQAAADLSFKAHGLSVLAAAFVVRATVASGDRTTEFGGNVQTGYMLVPRHIELAARFAAAPVGDETLHELLGVLNWLRHGHQQKWQVESGITRLTHGDGIDWTLRVQSQIAF